MANSAIYNHYKKVVQEPQGHFSPLHLLPALSRKLGIQLYVKRDDLLPWFLGGNKVRKNLRILFGNTTDDSPPDVILTNGGAESNHARVCALMASALNIGCHLVLHSEKPFKSPFNNGNSYFLGVTQSKVTFCDPQLIADTLKKLEKDYRQMGKKVCVIPGGGHCLEGGLAYTEAVDELPFVPDFIVLASGTGATQAGLIAGVKKRKLKTQVTGISIAREKARGTDAVFEIFQQVCEFLNLSHFSRDDVDFRAEYTHGGYEQYHDRFLDEINTLNSLDGVPFDPVYTGKAILALASMVENREIPLGKKVVFWHTGGLMNLQTSKKSN